MAMIKVGIVSPPPTDGLKRELAATKAAIVTAETQGHRLGETGPSLEVMIHARPEVVIVDMSDPEKGLSSVRILRSALPDAYLLVVAAANDTRLIIEAMRAGAREFLLAPVLAPNLLEALSRYKEERRLGARETESTGRLCSIIAGKLSSGATTVAINTAHAIATASGSATLLVDLDIPLGDAAAYLNLRPQYTIQEALAAHIRLDATLLDSFTVKVKQSNLNLLGGFREYTQRSAVSPEALDHLLRVSRAAYRHTIVDLSGSIDSEQAGVVARHSELILVVLTPDLPAIWRTERLLTFLSHHGAGENIRLVLNRTSRKDDIGEKDIERLLSQRLCHTLPNDYGACLKAINAGRPLQPEDSKALHHALRSLGLQIANIEESADSRGLLGLFLRPSTLKG